MKELFSKFGLHLAQSSTNRNFLNVDQNVFISRFKKHLANDKNCIDIEFIKSNLYSKELILPNLSPTMSDPLGCETCRGAEQDSLTRILLAFDELREDLLSLLLMKAAEYIDDSSEPSIVRLIINELRQLGKNGLSLKFVIDYIDLIGISYNDDMSAFLIDSIVEIFDDSSFRGLCAKLSVLYAERSELRSSILNAVVQMYEASPDAIDNDFVSVVIKNLPYASASLLSSIIRFMFVAHTQRAIVDVFPFIFPDGLVIKSLIGGLLYRPSLINSLFDEISNARIFRAIDLLILFNMYALNMHKNKILSILKQKIIISKIINYDVIHEMFKKSIDLVSVNGTLKICNLSMKSTHNLVNDFALDLYQCALMFYKTDKTADLFANAIVNHIFFGSYRERLLGLGLLEKLTSLHSFILLRLLLDNDTSNFSTDEGTMFYRYVVKMALKDESVFDKVIMNIVNQLNNHCSRRIGIIAAINTLRCLLEENRQWFEIKPLFHLLFNNTRKDSMKLCFFYDELSLVANELLKNSAFVQELLCQTSTDFNEFIVSTTTHDVKHSDDKSLDFGIPKAAGSNTENSYAVCIYDSVLRSFELVAVSSTPKSAPSFPALLYPSFRLISKLAEENISSQSAHKFEDIIRFPVMLHSFSTQSALLNASKADRDAFFDSYFYALNWFRELLNACAHSDLNDDICMYGLERIRNICDLEEKLNSLLIYHSSYSPPCIHFTDECSIPKVSDFLSLRKFGATRRKRKFDRHSEVSSSPQASSFLPAVTLDNENDDGGRCSNDSESIFDVSLYTKYACFREIFLNSYHILSRAVFSCSKSNGKRNVLNLREVEFILKDLCHKASFYEKLHENTHPYRSGDVSYIHRQLSQLTFEKFLSDMSVPLKFAFDALNSERNRNDSFSSYFQSSYGDDVDMKIFDKDIYERCLEKFFSCLAKIFACSFCVGEHFMKFCFSITASSDISESFECFFSLYSVINSIKTAVAFLQCVHSFQVRNANCQTVTAALPEAYESFIQRDWLKVPQNEHINGSMFNKMLSRVLRDYFSAHQNITGDSVAEEICLHRLLKVLDGSVCADDKYLTLRKNTARIYFNALLEFALTRAQNMTPSCHEKLNVESMEILKKWSDIVKLFNVLVMCIRNCASARDQKLMARNFIRQGNKFVAFFAKNALPLIDSIFVVHKEQCFTLLKNLQPFTRYLHHACTQTKSVLHDVSLAKIIPSIKKLLEKFIYDVQKILRKNNLQEAFSCGQLKNRNLKGEEIPSQIITVEEEDNSDDNEEKSDSDRTENSDNESSTIL